MTKPIAISRIELISGISQTRKENAMTTLTRRVLDIPAAEINGNSSLPLLHNIDLHSAPTPTELDENDELYVGYGVLKNGFPYTAQDNYGHELTSRGLDSFVLENEHLRAVFMPDLGGKLWSLYDKDAEKELLFNNHVYRPAFLAIRNAWTSGGVEWNCGAFTGHHPYTCSRIFTAVISKENSGLNCPVLRFYSYERIVEVTHQMDFYLPEGSRFLHCRMRVVNDNAEAIPMYWWSNIAVKSDKDSRVVVPVDDAYTCLDNKIFKVPVPKYDGKDISYPTNNNNSIDYFFNTRKARKYYTSHIGKDGYGFVQTSTSRLKSRKLFVWGTNQGSMHWQDFLSGDDGNGNYCDGKYCEIQCGLASTQYESIPMPPKTAWEWIEYYGAIQADPTAIHGDWHGAQKELERFLDANAPVDSMEKELTDTHKMATSAADEVILYGEGWASLENIRRKKAGMPPLCPHLDFGAIGEEQTMWSNLVKIGSLRISDNEGVAHPPLSYQRNKKWIKLMKDAVNGPDKHFWLTHYMLGCAYLSEGDEERAEHYLERSCALNSNAWNTYAIAELYRVKGDIRRAALTMVAAARMAPQDDSLCKMTAMTLSKAGLSDVLEEFIKELNDAQKNIPRIKLYRAIEAERSGDLDLSSELLFGNGGLVIPDFMEGEVSVTELWYNLSEKLAKRDGKPFEREKAIPPFMFDFRMQG